MHVPSLTDVNNNHANNQCEMHNTKICRLQYISKGVTSCMQLNFICNLLIHLWTVFLFSCSSVSLSSAMITGQRIDKKVTSPDLGIWILPLACKTVFSGRRIGYLACFYLSKMSRSLVLFQVVTTRFLIKYTKYKWLSNFFLLFSPIPKSIRCRMKPHFCPIFSSHFSFLYFVSRRKFSRVVLFFDRFTTILFQKNGVRWTSFLSVDQHLFRSHVNRLGYCSKTYCHRFLSGPHESTQHHSYLRSNNAW